MPVNTPRLNIPKPLGNETVNRAAFNTIYDTIDANAATRKEPEILALDIFASGFVVSGMQASKNATIANQLDVTAGACYVQQADGGLRRFTPAAASFTTSVASTVYYLDFQPDGTYSWGTAHSVQSGYIPVAEVTTDAAGVILTVTDKRPLVPGIGKVNADLVRGVDVVGKFDPSTGHKHTGTAGDGPKLASGDITYSSAISGFTPADVKAALDTLAGVRIVEKGSNANGEYVRWENGYQICWFVSPTAVTASTPLGSVFVSAEIIWTYPAAFYSQPIVEASASNYMWATNRVGTTINQASIVLFSPDSGRAGGYYLLAVGRWK